MKIVGVKIDEVLAKKASVAEKIKDLRAIKKEFGEDVSNQAMRESQSFRKFVLENKKEIGKILELGI